jgi:hypothetical protein
MVGMDVMAGNAGDFLEFVHAAAPVHAVAGFMALEACLVLFLGRHLAVAKNDGRRDALLTLGRWAQMIVSDTMTGLAAFAAEGNARIALSGVLGFQDGENRVFLGLVMASCALLHFPCGQPIGQGKQRKQQTDPEESSVTW